MSSASPASPSGWASDELFVLRDDSIPLEHCFAHLGYSKFYQQALEHFQPSLPKVVCPLEDTQMDTALTTYSNAQYMFGVQHNGGNTLMAALMQRYPRLLKTRRWESFRQCLRGWTIAHTWSHAKKLYPQTCGFKCSKTGGRFLLGHVVQLSSAFGTSSVANTTVGTTKPLRSRIRALLSAPQADGQCTKTNLTDVSILLDWKWCPLDVEGRVHFAHGRQGSSPFLFSHHLLACQSLNLQNVTLYQARHSDPSLCFLRCRGSRIRANRVLCHSICKVQTSLAFQQSYRVDLRRDIKGSSHCRRSVDSAAR